MKITILTNWRFKLDRGVAIRDIAVDLINCYPFEWLMNFRESENQEVRLRKKLKNKNYREMYLTITGISVNEINIICNLTDNQGYIVSEINFFGSGEKIINEVQSLVKQLERIN